nr:hypothetical protein [Luxibacter massiliensis]
MVCVLPNGNNDPGILDSKKQGMNVVYWIADERVLSLIDAIKEQYCGEEAE